MHATARCRAISRRLCNDLSQGDKLARIPQLCLSRLSGHVRAAFPNGTRACQTNFIPDNRARPGSCKMRFRISFNLFVPRGATLAALRVTRVNDVASFVPMRWSSASPLAKLIGVISWWVGNSLRALQYCITVYDCIVNCIRHSTLHAFY